MIEWLTSFDESAINAILEEKISFEEFFRRAKLNTNTEKITGVICGYRIEGIKNELTKKVWYLDKIVDELAKGKSLEKIMRT